MKQIKTQPIFNYMRYPNSPQCVIDMVDGGRLLEWLEPMRGNIGKPVYVTDSFFGYMKRAIPSFKTIAGDIHKEYEGCCGLLTTHEFASLDDGDNKSSLSIVWDVRGGVLTVAMLMTYQRISCVVAVVQSSDEEGTFNQYVSKSFEERTKEVLTSMVTTLAGILQIYLCLVKYADVEVVELKHGKQAKIKEGAGEETYRAQGSSDYDILDCRWFREIVCDHDISVRGHFRLQPCKDEHGEWTKKLIYINEFVKHGYHRKATIEKIREGA